MNESRRLALIIANNEYNDATLKSLITPGLDAIAFASVLRDPRIGGFEVDTLINSNWSQTQRKIDDFFDCNRDDLVLLYFSGHGIKDDDGRLYLATTDTLHNRLRSSAIPTTFINDIMAASRSRKQVLILDCCHSGAFATGMVAKGGESVDLKERFQGRGRIVLTASNSTQYAFQGDDIFGDGQKSVFTRYLVKGLESGDADRNKDGWISLDELYEYAFDGVQAETSKQTPGKWCFDLQGDILIASSPYRPQSDMDEADRLALSYADGIAALASGRWNESLEIFERLNIIKPGYRDVREQISRLKLAVSSINGRNEVQSKVSFQGSTSQLTARKPVDSEENNRRYHQSGTEEVRVTIVVLQVTDRGSYNQLEIPGVTINPRAPSGLLLETILQGLKDQYGISMDIDEVEMLVQAPNGTNLSEIQLRNGSKIIIMPKHKSPPVKFPKQ